MKPEGVWVAPSSCHIVLMVLFILMVLMVLPKGCCRERQQP
jgi:hypothetical protein